MARAPSPLFQDCTSAASRMIWSTFWNHRPLHSFLWAMAEGANCVDFKGRASVVSGLVLRLLALVQKHGRAGTTQFNASVYRHLSSARTEARPVPQSWQPVEWRRAGNCASVYSGPDTRMDVSISLSDGPPSPAIELHGRSSPSFSMHSHVSFFPIKGLQYVEKIVVVKPLSTLFEPRLWSMMWLLLKLPSSDQ